MALDWHDVSSRISGLLNIGDEADLHRTAVRLGIPHDQIQQALEGHSRLSALKVAAAIVRVYGIDPTWLLTGQYNAETHRAGQRKDPTEIDRLLKRLVCDTSVAPGRRQLSTAPTGTTPSAIPG